MFSQKDLENLKAEVARRHQLQEANRNRDKAEEQPMAPEPEPEPERAVEDMGFPQTAKEGPSSLNLQG